MAQTPQFRHNLSEFWQGSVVHTENTFHQLAPYIGKMKSSMAGTLISTLTRRNDWIYDPYCGSGTVALEAWAKGRNIIANDLSPYATVLTQAKLIPPSSIHNALIEVDRVAKKVDDLASKIDLRKIPKWVRIYFHPQTLREVIAWFYILRVRKSYFVLSCLLGILHHQRPGFLSYPCSHTVPYLRHKKYPRDQFPEMYEYRSVRDRLEKKILRAYKRVPCLDFSLNRKCYMRNAEVFSPNRTVNAIITSPAYMAQLDYGRDNRLRLWFLGVEDWRSLDYSISPSEKTFFLSLKKCLNRWKKVLAPNGYCIFVLGDTYSRLYQMPLPSAVSQIALQELGGYSFVWQYNEPIPDDRRVRRSNRGTTTETVLILRRNKGL